MLQPVSGRARLECFMEQARLTQRGCSFHCCDDAQGAGEGARSDADRGAHICHHIAAGPQHVVANDIDIGGLGIGWMVWVTRSLRGVCEPCMRFRVLRALCEFTFHTLPARSHTYAATTNS